MRLGALLTLSIIFLTGCKGELRSATSAIEETEQASSASPPPAPTTTSTTTTTTMSSTTTTTQPPAPPSPGNGTGLFKNLPAGNWNMIGDFDGVGGDATASNAFNFPFSPPWYTNNPGRVRSVSDPTNPRGTGEVLEIAFHQDRAPDPATGDRGHSGAGTANLFFPQKYNELYIQFNLKYESAFELSPKIFYFGASSTQNWVGRRVDSNFQVIPQGAQHYTDVTDVGRVWPGDRWVNCEIYLVSASTGDGRDGQIHIYIDGVHMLSRYDKWFYGGETGFGFIQWYGQISAGSTRVNKYWISSFRLMGR